MRELGVGLAIVTVLGWAQVASAAVVLNGETSRPNDSTFCLGEKPVLKWNVQGLEAGKADSLTIVIKDEHDVELERRNVPVVADATGRWQGQTELAVGRQGSYRVFATLGNGVSLPANFTRPAGFLTYAVVPDVTQRKDFGQADSRFGLQGSLGPNSAAALPRLGVRWILDGRAWYWREPKAAGEFKARTPEAVKEEQAKAKTSDWKFYRLHCIDGVPAWAGKADTRAPGSRNAELTLEGEKAYAAYCREAAREVVQTYSDEPVRYYQPLWEPVAPWGYKGSDAGLVRIMQIAYEAVHAVDPKAVVVGPGGSSMDKAQIQWNERLLKAGISKYVDAISTHPYVPNPAENNNYIENLRAFDAAIQRATGKKLPIMGTEQGITTHEGVENELGQAQGMVRQNLMTLGEGFFCNYAFYAADFRLGRETGYGMYYNLDPNKVSWNSDFVSPKPVVPAYAAMTMLLDGKRSNGPIQGLSGSTLGYAFQREAEIVGALWDSQRKDVPLELPVGKAPILVYDWMGRPLTPQISKGLLRLNLGPEPVYVAGLPVELYGGPAERRLALSTSEVTVLPEESKSIAGRIRLGTGEKASDFVISVESNGLAGAIGGVKVDAKGEFTVPIKVPAQTVPGNYAVRLVARRDGVVAGIVESKVEVRPVIDLSKPVPGFADGKPVLVVSVGNNSGRAQTVKLVVSVDAQVSTETVVNLPAGKAKLISLPCPVAKLVPSQRYPVEIVAHVEGWAPTRQKAEVNFLGAVSIRQPITADGDLSDWTGIESFTVAGRENVIRSPLYYIGGVESKFRFAWDARALYLACEVKSPSHLQPFSGANTWKGDCIQLAVNLTPGKADTKTGNMAADAGAQDYSEMTLALTEGGPQAVRSISFDPARLPATVISKDEMPLAIARKGDTTVYELAIPWSSLGRQSPGQVIGIAATVNKIFFADQPDPSALGLFDGIAASKDPEKFGTLVLK